MKPLPSRLLCATDFTPAAHEAAAVAAGLAARFHRSLTLVHATGAGGADPGAPAQRKIREEALRLRQQGVLVQPVLLREPPAGAALLGLLEREPPALVVLAGAAKPAVDRWRFGSLTDQVAQSAAVPTLVVRQPSALDRWTRGAAPLRVLMALDLKASSNAVLRWVREWRRAGPCELIACHCNPRPTRGADERALARHALSPVNPPAVQSRLERQLRKQVRDELGDEEPFRVIVRPDWGEPAAALLEVAARERPDLLVIGSHQRHGLSRLLHGSLSRAVLRRARMNVACVPITAEFDPRDAHLPEYRRVLVATDFSELGNAAIPHACAACVVGGLLRIIHVVSPRARSRPQDEWERRLRALVPAELGARAQPPQLAVLRDADPARAICAEAEAFGADLVCLSSHGASASRDVFGSVAEAVLRRLRRPLLIVRRPDE